MDKRLQEIVYQGSDRFQENQTLTEIFSHEVANQKLAWYIDYFTEDAENYRVRYIAEDGKGKQVLMTNENKIDRDPNDPESTQWNSDDVAGWFKIDEAGAVQHRWLCLFQHPSGELFGIHFEAYRLFAFGPASLSLPLSSLWDAYVEDGIRGPIMGCGDLSNIKVSSIIVDPNVRGYLENAGLLTDYMNALATTLDS